MILRKRFRVHGVVQGVGFRPFVHQLATRLRISGHVFNSSAGVVIEAEGTELERFERGLREELPPLARIDAIEVFDLETRGDEQFVIRASVEEPGTMALLPPDASTCGNCLAEVLDPGDRRFGYPFTNCTHCGPRYTIIRDLPYDRPHTTMAAFEMCGRCAAEYEDPADRRFHAQPNACAQCGPSLSRPIDEARDAIGRGEIVAVRGLGGFQLICDATNGAAVQRLRERKRRSEKPFAIMVPDLAAAERLCAVDDAERRALEARERAIVILAQSPLPSGERARVRGGARIALSPVPPLTLTLSPEGRGDWIGVSRGDTLGVMLPYTPLHHLLVRGFEALVVTSGNVSEEPIVIDNDIALRRLAPIADSFLLHDRDIHTRVDDSVVRVFEDRPRVLRRSRSYAPRPIELGVAMPELLACGAQLKNTFCLTKGSQAFLSQHIGDLENYETLLFFEETLERMRRLFRIEPQAVAHDLHPNYLSTRFALGMDVERIGVQHHHAHIAACMAENGVRERVIGVAMDGTGYGTDGAIWGAEFLSADLGSFHRRAHFRYIPLAGGDAAVRQPWRVALSYLHDAGLRDAPLAHVAERDRRLVASMIERGINTVPASSAGRLFDAVAALLGLRAEATFEAQAAIELEALARTAEADCAYRYAIGERDPMQIDFRPMIAAIVDDRERGVPPARIAARFHETIAAVIEDVCVRIRDDEALPRVCLSGGTFQNWLLLGKATARLRRRGFEVLLHEHVPPNDGGISLGQAAIAGERLARGL